VRKNGYEYNDSTEAFYQTFNPECPDETKVDREVVDVVLSGRAESQFQPAWGNCEFWGRVRISDGLVVLIQHVIDFDGRHYGGRVCAGYVQSSQNFVGKWKYLTPGTQWEGIWSLNKVD